MENKVTVSFETFGGTTIKPVKVNLGTPVQEVIPSIVPEKAEHGFEGWFLNETLTNKALDFYDTRIEQDVIIYAKFNWYYPFEVSDIAHTYNNELRILTFTWKNPEDENFSHVNLNVRDTLEITTEQIAFGSFDPYSSSYIFKCVDKNGNYSKGITYIIEEDEINPFE